MLKKFILLPIILILSSFEAHSYSITKIPFFNRITISFSPQKNSHRNYSTKKRYNAQNNKIKAVDSPLKNIKLSCLIGNYFSRKHNITEIICSLISCTKKTINGALYLLTCKKLYKQLATADKNGVKIKLIFDKKQAMQPYSLVGNLIQKTNVEIYIPKDSNTLMHHKYTIYDDKVLANGSFNWSKAAGGSFDWKKDSKKINRENLSVENNPEKIAHFKQEFKEMLSECILFKQ